MSFLSLQLVIIIWVSPAPSTVPGAWVDAQQMFVKRNQEKSGLARTVSRGTPGRPLIRAEVTWEAGLRCLIAD